MNNMNSTGYSTLFGTLNNSMSVNIQGQPGPTGPTGPSGSTVLTTKGDLFTYSTTPTRLPVGADNNLLVSDSTQTSGIKWSNSLDLSSITTDALIIEGTNPQIKGASAGIQFVNGANSVTVRVSGPTSNGFTVTVPNVTANASFVLTENSQVINGGKTFTGQVVSNNSFLVAGTIPRIYFANGGQSITTTIQAPIPSASRVYSIQDAGASANFILSEGAQTINGVKTFGSGIMLPSIGGTPSSFSHYEEYSWSSPTDTTMGANSLWTTSPQNATATVIRIGKMVHMIFDRFMPATNTNNAAPLIRFTTNLPSQFAPASTRYGWTYTLSNNGSPMNGLVFISNSGQVRNVYRNIDATTNWPTATPACGFEGFTVSWSV